MNYFTLNTISELVCFAFSISCLIKDKSWVWRSMIVYLFVTCLAEFAGIYIEKVEHNNQWVYNIFLVFEGVFNILMFNHIFQKYKKNKLLTAIAIALFMLFYSFELIKHGFRIYNYSTYKVMSLLYVLYCLYYYYLLVKDDTYTELKFHSTFWWITGTLFFYFGNTACNFLDDKLSSIKIFGNEYLTYFIYKILNIILYAFWSYSFFCRKWLMLKSKSW